MLNTQLATITSESSKTEVTLVKSGVLKSRLGKMSKDSIATTLSLAYYTAINGNVAPLATSLSNITSLLHPVYRQYICAKFNPETQVWEYNKAKAQGLLNKLGLKFNDCTFEAFVAALEEQVETKQAKVDKLQADKDALTPTEIKAKDDERLVKYLAKNLEGMTDAHIQDLIIKAKASMTTA